MKRFLWLGSLVILLRPPAAPAGEAAKLAIIGKSDNAASASDLLTAALSSNTNVHLLERNEIDKVYREQGLSAGNPDYIKMGQVLGADGLVLIDETSSKKPVRAPLGFGARPADLRVRLVAVKPGVVLQAQEFSMMPNEMTDWADGYARSLDPLLPKLTVLVKNAIPISLVSLRCATPSADAQETERALSLLTVERLSQESRVFVLERQRMATLKEEKDLQSDNAAFWSGSYLLDGVVDRNGYNQETITIDATLQPPHGSAPVAIDVSGSRNNLAEVINRLAAKVNEAVQISATAPQWNAKEEAAQFFKEGEWALKWKALAQAQAAADAAWALGKQDLDGAILRVKAYEFDADGIKNKFDTLESSISPGYDASGRALGVVRDDDPSVRSSINRELRQHTNGAVYTKLREGDDVIIDYVFANGAGDPRYLQLAARMLEYYRQFCQTQAEAGQKVAAWYQLGVDCLATAGQVLKYYNLFPQQGEAVADDVAGLRALARSVADMMAKSPKVQDSYFVGDRILTHDVLSGPMWGKGNLFDCEVVWGCYWQERPEDAIALYRQLMSSPVFTFIHQDLWSRPNRGPRLAAWNESDRQHIPVLWHDFMQELAGSPDVQHQLEAKAFAVMDAKSDEEKGRAFTNFFDSLTASRDALLAYNVEVLYLDWGAGNLVPSGSLVTPLKEELDHVYRTKYRPILEDMDLAYWNEVNTGHKSASQAESQNDPKFEQRKAYLKALTPYDFQEFARLFGSSDFTRAQALELQPLMAAYIANMTAQAGQLSGLQQSRIKGGIHFAAFILQNMERKTSAEAAPPAMPPSTTIAIRPAPAPQRMAGQSAPLETAVPSANIISVTHFLELPSASVLRHNNRSSEFGGDTIIAHQWVDDKLLLDLKCGAFEYSFNAQRQWTGTYNVTYPAVAWIDPQVGQWNVAICPEVDFSEENYIYYHTTLFEGELYTCNAGRIAKYDSASKSWRRLDVSDGNQYALFNVNHHLYAANNNTVFEIVDGGKASRLMASGRRQPPASALDSLDLGTPAMFQGPAQSLRLAAAGRFFTWTGSDWRSDGEVGPAVNSGPRPSVPNGVASGGLQAQILPDGVLFEGSTVSRLATENNSLEICLQQKIPGPRDYGLPSVLFQRPQQRPQTSPPAKTTWDLPATSSLAGLVVTSHQPDLYVLRNHSDVQDIVNEQQHTIVGTRLIPRDGYHAELLCFISGQRWPLRLGLKFDEVRGTPPLGKNQTWMLATPGGLVFGAERPPMGFSPIPPQVAKPDRLGVWWLPFAELQPAIAVAKETQSNPVKTAASGVPGAPSGP